MVGSDNVAASVLMLSLARGRTPTRVTLLPPSGAAPSITARLPAQHHPVFCDYNRSRIMLAHAGLKHARSDNVWWSRD